MSGSFGPNVPANIGMPQALQSLFQAFQSSGTSQAEAIAPPPPPVAADRATQEMLDRVNSRQAAADARVEAARAGRGGESSLSYQQAVAAARAARDPGMY